MTRENTIGIIVFRREGAAIQFLLLHKKGHYWSFAKGHAEPGEDHLTTAKRELAEESGITDITIVDGFKEEFDFDFDTEVENGVRQKVYKHMILFLGETTQKEVTVSHEHLDYGWFDFSTALKRAFYQNGQNALKKAYQFLLKDSRFVL